MKAATICAAPDVVLIILLFVCCSFDVSSKNSAEDKTGPKTVIMSTRVSLPIPTYRRRSIMHQSRDLLLLCFLAVFVAKSVVVVAQDNSLPQMTIRACDDFEITGRGDAEPWNKADWVPLQRREPGTLEYTARFKMMYSAQGVYVLFDGSDRKLTASMREDFLDLWNEDVMECFFWTSEQHPVYFEYEISPLGYELPILVPNFDGASWVGGPGITKVNAVSRKKSRPVEEKANRWRT